MVKKEDLKLFISETEDLIQQVEDSILLLEQKPRTKKPIKDLFFAFHTIKGLTGMVGLDNLSRFCHHFETFLEKNKESKKAIKDPDEFINFLFEGLDVLRTMVNRSKKGELVDLDIQFLNEIEKTFDDFEQEYEITFIDPLSSTELKSVIEDKQNKFFKIYIRIQPSCIFKKVRLFIIFRALNKVGRIAFSNPKPELLEKGHFENDFEIYFLSKKDKNVIDNKINEILEIETRVINQINDEEFIRTVSVPHLKKPTPKRQKDERKALQMKNISVRENEEEPETVSAVYDETIAGMDTKVTSIKVDIGTLEHLMNLFGELVVVKNQISQIIKDKQIWEVNRLFDNMDKHFLEIQEVIFQLKLVRVGSIFRRYRRMVRDLAKEYKKDINFILEGMDVEIDRKILEELSSPIIHILRNAIYHGIESPKIRKIGNKDPTGLVRLRTYRQAGSIYVEIEDDGKGLDYEAIRQKLIHKEKYSPEEVHELSEDELVQHILKPGFSTLENADLTSGRGMGLAIVTEKIKELSGSFQLISKSGIGTKIILNVPFTRAILKAQLVDIAGDLFAIPMDNIHQIYTYNRKLVEYVKGSEFYRIESKLIPIIRLNKFFKLQSHNPVVNNPSVNNPNVNNPSVNNPNVNNPSVNNPNINNPNVNNPNVSNLDENKKDESGLTENTMKIKKSNMDKSASTSKVAIWCFKDENKSAILVVDNVKQQMEVVVKPFRSKYSNVSGISGATITGDGSICLILDVPELIGSKIQDSKEFLVAETV
ncbi:MAG: chemotaxis protein CheA [Promethearchaeota archaeon]